MGNPEREEIFDLLWLFKKKGLNEVLLRLSIYQYKRSFTCSALPVLVLKVSMLFIRNLFLCCSKIIFRSTCRIPSKIAVMPQYFRPQSGFHSLGLASSGYDIICGDLDIKKSGIGLISFLNFFLEFFKHSALLFGNTIDRSIIRNYLNNLICEAQGFTYANWYFSDVRMAIFDCYYSPYNFGVVKYLNERHAPTIDLQHGQQGLKHPMYWDILEIHDDRIPKYFWIWAHYFTRNFGGDTTDQKRILALGNPKWDPCLVRQPTRDTGLERGRIKVLIVLQPHLSHRELDFFTKIVEKIALKYPISVTVRRHPNQKFEVKDLSMWKVLGSVSDIELDEATDVLTFDYYDLVVVYNSTVCWDAWIAGVSSIILDKSMTDSTGPIISAGYAHVIDPSDSESDLKSVLDYLLSPESGFKNTMDNRLEYTLDDEYEVTLERLYGV